MTFLSKHILRRCFLWVTPLMAACSFQPTNTQTPTAPAATWFVTPVQVVSSENTASDPVWSLPTERTYRLRACVRDTVTSQPRIGETIRLVATNAQGAGQNHSAQLDPEGCFYWAQNVSYLFLADETFGELDWEVRLGGESQTLRLAFNPWKEGPAGLIDLSHSTEPMARKLAPPQAALSAFKKLPSLDSLPTMTGDAARTNLVIHSVETPVWQAPHQLGEKSILPAVFRISVAATHLGIDDKPIDTPLPSGDLRFKAHLVEIGEDGSESLVARLSKPANTTLVQGWLEAKAEFELLRQADPAREKALYFALIPADSSAGVSPAFRRIRLGAGQKTPEAIAQQAFEAGAQNAVSSKVQDAAPRQNAVQNTGQAAVPLFRVVSYRATRAAAPVVARNWQATTQVLFEVCLRPTLELSPQAKQQLVGKLFHVRWNRAQEAAAYMPARVQDDGCVRWKQPLEYPFAGEETYWPGQLQLQAKTPEFLGTQFDIAYDVNPWRSGEFVGWDARELGAAPQNPVPGNAELVLDGYTAMHEGTYTYHVDKYLQLVLVRKVRFRLVPKLMRPYSFDQGASARVDLPQGLEMQLQASFHRADGKSVSEGLEKVAADADYLSSFTTTAIQTATGVLDAFGGVSIPFVNLSLWEARVQSRLTLSAVGAATAPSPALRHGLFNGTPLRNDQDSKILVEPEPPGTPLAVENPVQKLVDKTALRYEKGTTFFISHPWKQSPLEMYTERLKTYAPVKVTNQDDVPTAEQLDLNQSVAAARMSCPRSHQNLTTTTARASASECRNKPLKYFHVSALRVVESVNPEARMVRATHSTSELSATFFNERKFSSVIIQGESNRTSFQKGVKANLGYDKNGNGATAFTTFLHDNQQYTTEEGNFSQDWRNGNRGSNKTQLEKKEVELEITGTYRNCLVVRPLPPAVTLFGSHVQMQCSEPVEGTFSQNFYSFEDVANHYVSPLIDTGDPNQRGWRKILRGKDAFQAFDRMLSDATRYFVLKKIESFHDGLEYTLEATLTSPLARYRLYQDGGIFPGVSDAVEYSDIQWSDIEIRQASDKLARELVHRSVDEAVAARYAYCYVAELAMLVPHGEYRKNAESVEKYQAELLKTGTEARCQEFAKDKRWDTQSGGTP